MEDLKKAVNSKLFESPSYYSGSHNSAIRLALYKWMKGLVPKPVVLLAQYVVTNCKLHLYC